MRRKGYTTFVLIASFIIGLGVMGFMYGLSGALAADIESAVREQSAFVNAKSLSTVIEEDYVHAAMNWSFYRTSYEVARDVEKLNVKQWYEKNLRTGQAHENVLEQQAKKDFRKWYLDNQDFPVRNYPVQGKLTVPDMLYSVKDRLLEKSVYPRFTLGRPEGRVSMHSFGSDQSAADWYRPKAVTEDGNPHISDDLPTNSNQFAITLYTDQWGNHQSLVFYSHTSTGGSARIDVEQVPGGASVAFADDAASNELELGRDPAGQWDWNGGKSDGGVIRLPDGWQSIKIIPESVGPNLVVQGKFGSVDVPDDEPFFINSSNMVPTEGMKVTAQTARSIATAFTGGGPRAPARATVYTAPKHTDHSAGNRFFYFRRLAADLTANKTFRRIVEMAAMNVSKYLQVEHRKECDLDGGGAVVHGAGYGDGSNDDSSPPYNDGPDCKTGTNQFNLAGNTPTGPLESTVNEAEQKYAARIAPILEWHLNQNISPVYERPSQWKPKVGQFEDYRDVNVELDVVDIDYHLYNFRRQPYRDRKVSRCAKSHTGTFDRVTLDRTAMATDTSCNSDCGSTCTGSSFAKQDYTSTCSGTNLNCDQSDGPATCDCSGLSGCPTPSYFPLHTNPPHSVHDGVTEVYTGTSPPYGLTADQLSQADPDGPGRKDQNSVTRTNFEHDNACQVGSYVAEVPNSASGDAIIMSDEKGTFRRCKTPETKLFVGTDNPWIIRTDATYEPFGTDQEPNWGRGEFEDRHFEGDYSRSSIVDIARATGRTVPFNSPTLASEHNTCNAGESECEYSPSCTCDLDTTTTTWTDPAYEDEVLKTSAEFRVDVRAHVTVRVTVTDQRYKVPTEEGYRPFQFRTEYHQFAISTFRSTSASSENCVISDPVDPDDFTRDVPPR